jgi:pimeloyl-ACP methyl ester carboxylesterase
MFSTLDLRFNYLLPVAFSPFTFEKNLLAALKENNIAKISLFGHSMGGFVASEFASKHTKLIDEIFLVGIRKKYTSEGLKDVRRQLKKNKKAFLYKVYMQSFYNKDELHWFRDNLLKDYCEEFDLGYLLKTLDYLEDAELKPELLNKIKKIKIIHGELDPIAPIQEAADIKNSLPHARFIRIKEAGHIPFLRKDFAGII